MKKRFVALLTAAIMLMCQLGAAASTAFTLGYSAGDTTFTLGPSSCAAAEGVKVSDAAVAVLNSIPDMIRVRVIN